MNWQEALTQIESLEFDANLSVVSSTKAFFRNVAQDPVVLDLYWQIQESGELKESILDRTYDLSAQEIDMRHGNPNDKPLAVLLWLSYYAAPELGRLAATYTARAPNAGMPGSWHTKFWTLLQLTAATSRNRLTLSISPSATIHPPTQALT